MERHSNIASAAYADLLRLLKDEMASDIRGTVVRRTINGRGYLYDHHRIGSKVVATYLGEDTSELQERIARHAEIAEGARARRRERGRLVRLLRGDGMGGFGDDTGPILAALAKAGVFRLGGTLVGTVAFRLYEAELGIRFPFDETAMTRDIDIAQFEKLSLALDDRADPGLEETFKELKFEPIPDLDPRRTWRWQQGRGSSSIEFLTPAFGDEGVRDLPVLGVSAMALRHLNYLISEPIKAAVIYRAGTLVQIPRPERYAIHKLIVAQRRRGGDDANKAVKDRRQAAFLIDILAEDRPDDLAEVYEDAWDSGPRWQEQIKASLSHMPKTAQIVEAIC